MKKFKKVVPALCALLVSAVMLGSSTYAWFSMNTKVTAKGMSVTAQSNSTYLVISKNTTLGTDISASLNGDNAVGGIGGTKTSVYPSAKAEKDITGTEIKAGDWYYAASKKRNDAGAVGDGALGTNTLSATKIGTELTADYQVTYTFYIGLSGESKAMDNATIKVDAADATAGNSSVALGKGLSAEVKIGDKDAVTLKDGTTNANVTGVNLSNTAITVTVMVYIDGNNANVTSAATDLSDLALNLAFSIVLG